MLFKKKIKRMILKIRKHKVLRIPIGISFIIIGIVGLFLPILQGGICIFLGLYILFGDKFEKYLKEKENETKKQKLQKDNKR